MDNNDLLRRLRYALRLDDADTARLAALGGRDTRPEEASAWRLQETDDGFVACDDAAVLAILDGLIVDRRGPPDPGKAAPEENPALDNNRVLKSLRIALSLRSEAVHELLVAGGSKLSSSETSALLRKPGTRNYRSCGDQVLRQLLTGLTRQSR